jgi:hypothetical protein
MVNLRFWLTLFLSHLNSDRDNSRRFSPHWFFTHGRTVQSHNNNNNKSAKTRTPSQYYAETKIQKAKITAQKDLTYFR